MLKIVLQIGLGIGVGALLFWLAVRGVDIDAVKRDFVAISPVWIVAAVAIYFTALAVRTIRWWLILRTVTALTIRQVGVALLTGYAVNALLAARLGELFRADFCRRQYGVSRTAIIGSIMLERFTDGVIVLTALSVGVVALDLDSASSHTIRSVLGLGIAVFGLLGAAAYVLGSRRLGRRVNERLVHLPAVTARVATLRESLRVMRSTQMIGVILVSVVVWMIDGAALWAVLKSCGIQLGFLEMCLVVGIVSLSTLLPSPPGFLGTMQFAFVLSVTLFGYSSSQGLVAALANQVFLLGSMVAVGLILLATAYSRHVYHGARAAASEIGTN